MGCSWLTSMLADWTICQNSGNSSQKNWRCFTKYSWFLGILFIVQ
jgi:hypothetical protein